MKQRLTLFLSVVFAISCFAQEEWKQHRRKAFRVVAATSFQDTFEVSNQNPMPTTSTSGGTWTLNIDSSQNLQIVSGACAATDSSGANSNMARAASPTLTADQVAGVTIDSTGAADISVSVRCDSSGLNNYTLQIANSTLLALYEANSGTYTQMGGYFNVTALSAGDIVDLRVTGTSTTTLEVFINSVSQGTRTDSTSPHTTGQPALNIYGTPDVEEFHASNYP